MKKSDILVVMGNGPSLADVNFRDLDGYDTFGLNSAYRAYRRLNWYPTYHGCFDYVVTDSHEESFKSLVEDSPIKKCFYLKDLSSSPKLNVINLQTYGHSHHWNDSEKDFKNFNDNGNSGANACSVGVCLGYKKIILLGVDCNYVEFVEGSGRHGSELIMNKTPDKNPNYWFDDYQQKGDKYNVPRGLDFHMPTWNMFAYRACHNGIDVINCSPISNLKCFKKMNLKEALG